MDIKVLGREISEVRFEDSMSVDLLGNELMEYDLKRNAEYFRLVKKHVICLLLAYFLSLMPFLRVFEGLTKNLQKIVFFGIPVCAVAVVIIVCRVITNHRLKKTVHENIFSDEKKRQQLMVIALRDLCLHNPTRFLKVEEHMVSVRNMKTKMNMEFDVDTCIEEDNNLSDKMRVIFCNSCVKFILPVKQNDLPDAK